MREKRRISEKISDMNLKNVLKYLIRNPEGVARTQLCKELHVSFPAISSNVKKMMEQGLIVEEDKQTGNVTLGRTPKIVKLNEEYGVIAAVHIGYKSVSVSVLNMKAVILCKLDFEVSRKISFSQLCTTLVQKINEALDRSSLGDCEAYSQNLIAISIALPGIIDGENSKLVSSKYYKWQDVELPQFMMINDMEVDVYWENDSNVLARGVFYEDSRLDNILAFYMGRGVGIGIIINKKLYSGSRGMAGEMGDITFPMGEKTVSLEQFISEESLVQFAREKMNIDEPDNLSVLVKMDEKIEDEKYRENFKVISNYVGNFFALLVRAFDPQKVVFDGTIARNCPNLSHMIVDKLRNFTDIGEEQLCVADGNETTMLKGLFLIAICKALELESVYD